MIITFVSPHQAVQIDKWRKVAHRVGIVDPHPNLVLDHCTPERSPRINPGQEVFQVRLEQGVRNENELSQHLEQYATQEDHVLRLVIQIGEKFQQYETPKRSDKPNRVPSTPLPSHSTSVGLGSQHQFQVKAKFDFGEFSRNDLTPSRVPNFDQWYVDVKASQ